MVAPRSTSPRGPILAGLFLILAGAVLLVGQQTEFHIDWPIWILVGGIATLGMAIVLGYSGPGADAAGTGIAVVGGIITAVGGVLAVQDATGAYASWAYAWALVAPGGVGLGLLVYGLAVGNGETARGGLGALITGLVLFLVFFIFFEGVLDLTTLGDDWLTGSVGPLILVGLGVLFIVGAMLPGPWRSRAAPASMGFATAAPGGSTGAGQGDLETIGIGLAGAPAADVAIAFGAGKLAIVGPAAAGQLVDGSCFGGVRREDIAPGRVRLSTPSEAIWQKPWGQAPFDWRLGLSGEVPLRLAIEVGAARTDADLSALQVSELRLRTGAAETSIVLPASAGFTRVDAEGGAATVRFRVPDGVAARIRSTMAIGTTDVDTVRFPRDPLGGWASPDFATAANRVEIEVKGGLGSVSIR
jgi:hypothetical protein